MKKIPVISFTAGKGGCGKTTLAVNFAHTIMKADKRVLVIDFDLSNRGSTGIFSKYIGKRIAEGKPYKTLTEILPSSTFETISPEDLIEIKPNYYFMPAAQSSDMTDVASLEKIPFEELASIISERFQKIAEQTQLDCIILDCFCGIDNLTTMGVCISDDSIFINEPDIVTFTGTIYLHRHIQQQLKNIPEDLHPRIHLVVNRMKRDFSIREMEKLYKDNLLVEFEQGIACHFPFHEKIFENFGKHPFWEDLLPNSLFIKKMNLLAWQIFSIKNPKLLTDNVRNWSNKKANELYYQYIDYNAIDSESLVLELSDLVAYSGTLVGIALLVNYYFSLSPRSFAIFLFLWFAAYLYVYCRKLIWPLYLSTRLNISIAQFQFKLNRIVNNMGTVKNMLDVSMRNISGFFMGFSAAAFSSVLISFFIFAFSYISNSTDKNPVHYIIHHTIPEIALNNNIIFRGNQILFNEINFTNTSINHIETTLSSDNISKFKGTTFEKCKLNINLSKQMHMVAFSADQSNLRFNPLKGADSTIDDVSFLKASLKSFNADPTSLARFHDPRNNYIRLSNMNFSHHSWNLNTFEHADNVDSSITNPPLVFINDTFNFSKFNFRPEQRVIFLNCLFNESCDIKADFDQSMSDKQKFAACKIFLYNKDSTTFGFIKDNKTLKKNANIDTMMSWISHEFWQYDSIINNQQWKKQIAKLQLSLKDYADIASSKVYYDNLTKYTTALIASGKKEYNDTIRSNLHELFNANGTNKTQSIRNDILLSILWDVAQKKTPRNLNLWLLEIEKTTAETSDKQIWEIWFSDSQYFIPNIVGSQDLSYFIFYLYATSASPYDAPALEKNKNIENLKQSYHALTKAINTSKIK